MAVYPALLKSWNYAITAKLNSKNSSPTKKKLVRTNLRYFTNVFIYQNIVMFYFKKID